MESFGGKLKRLRESKELSQEELAKELYVTRSAVAKWEQDRGFPNIDSLKSISTLFEVSIDYLVSDKELETLEVSNNKNLSVRTKLLAVLSVFLALIIVAGIILTAMFCPRKLSHYLKIQPEDVVAVCIINFAEGFDENGNFNHKTVKQELDSAYFSDFINDVKNIKIIPRYVDYKSEGEYWFYIETDNNGNGDTYRIDGYGMNNTAHNIVKYYGISDKIKSLLQTYDLYLGERQL